MKVRYFLTVLAILLGSVYLAINCTKPADAAKCDEPPFISTGVQSNVLFVLDNSGSMGRFAYEGSSGTVKFTTDPTNSYSDDFYPEVVGWQFGSWSTDGNDTPVSCMPLPCDSKTTRSSCLDCNRDGDGDRAWCRYWFPWSLGPAASPAGTGNCYFSHRCRWRNGNCYTQVSMNGRCEIVTGGSSYTFSYSCDEPDVSTPLLQGDFTAPYDVVPRTGRSSSEVPCTLPCSSCSNSTECHKGRWCRDWYPWQLGTAGDSGECKFSHWCSWSGGQCVETNFGYGRCEHRSESGKYSFSYNCNESTQTCRVTLTPRFPTYDFTNTKCTVTLTPQASTVTKNAYYTFDHGKEYYGYFNPDKLYKYDNTKHYFYTEDGPEWDAIDPDPDDGVVMRVACASSGTCDKFSGNWLNWLTMRRLDVAIKVLTGGRLGGDESEYVLIGSEPYQIQNIKMFNDNGSSGGYYTPFKTGIAIDFSMWDQKQRTGGNGKFSPLMIFYEVTFSSASQAQSVLDAGGEPKILTHSENPGEPAGTGPDRLYSNSYYFAVKVGDVDSDDAPAGVVQKMASKVRLGYMNFNYGRGPADGSPLGQGGRVVDIDDDGNNDVHYTYADGGRIINRIGDMRTQHSWQKKDGVPVPIMQVVQNINETRYAMMTPIAEVMREAMEYFKQNDSCYAWADETDIVHNNFETDKGGSCPALTANQAPSWDPFCQPGLGRDPCAKSYVVLVSDGSPNNDNPQKCGCKSLDKTTCSDDDSGDVNRTFRFDGTGFIDDIAYIMHTEDMRTDIGSASQPPIKQTVDFYGIYAFGTGSGRLQDAAVAGGFVDLNGDGQPGSGPPNPSNWRDAYWVNGYEGYYEWDSNGLSDNQRVPDHFFEAEDGYLLETYLESIFSKIATGGAAGAVATISQETSDGDVIVRGAFDTVDPQDRSKFIWRGRFEAYWPDKDGKYEFDDPTNSGVFCGSISGGECDGKPCCWDIAENMKDKPAGLGEIFTYVGGTKTPFEIASVTALQPFMLDSNGAVPSEADAKAIIQWVRGEVVPATGQPTEDGVNPMSGVPLFRDREGYRLGDIVYSTPVVVGPPSLAAVSRRDPNVAAFWAYRNVNVNRAKIAYVGGNDGMLHAFLVARWNDGGVAGDTEKRWDYQCKAADGYPDCGEQIWAYIPTNFLGELRELGKPDYGLSSGCKHRTLVDLGPKAWDVFIASPDCPADADLTPTPPSGCSTSRCWRTVLIGGERGGGDVYFAVDVTDPLNPRVLWEYSVLKNLPVVHTVGADEEMVLPFQNQYEKMRIAPMTWSEPALGRIQFPTSVKFPNLSGNPPTYSYIQYPQTSTDGTSTPCDSRRHVAFIGGGFRIFDPPVTSTTIWGTGAKPSPDSDTIRRALQRPNLLAMDVETGVNLFQVLWPLVVKTRDLGGMLPDERIPESGASNYMPWALADPVLLDLWNNDRDVFGEDGYVDRMYIGDFRGRLFRIGFNFKTRGPFDPPFLNGLRLDYWLTKPIRSVWTDPDSCDEQNMFRGCRQPITVPPAVSYDRGAAYSRNPSLRVMFGTGKFDDITGNMDDKTDTARMAFYNKSDSVKYERVSGSDIVKEGVPLIDPDSSSEVKLVAANPTTVDLSGTAGTDWTKGFSIEGTNLGIVFNDPTECDDNYAHFDCSETIESYEENGETFQRANRSNCCNWWVLGSDIADPTDDNADCCHKVSCPRCWDCVYDFADEGERVLGKATVRGGLVFFSTYSPTKEECSSGGRGWLYILSYDCKPFPPGFNPITAAFGRTVIQLHAENNTNHLFGAKVDLGMSMPSRPVLDTRGENVLVQSSDSSLIRIGVDTSLIRPVQFKGWEEQQ